MSEGEGEEETRSSRSGCGEKKRRGSHKRGEGGVGRRRGRREVNIVDAEEGPKVKVNCERWRKKISGRKLFLLLPF